MLGNRRQSLVNALLLMTIGLFAAIVLSTMTPGPSEAQQPATQQAGAEPAAPEGQTYVGTKECAACHFEQFMAWRQTPHAKAFEIMPAKYHTDASCLKCHATGHGTPSGFTSMQQTPNLAGNSCEGCHGPGSKHSEVAKSFGQKKLTPEEQQQVRDTIYMMLPTNVCAECHLSAGHKKHPPFDK
jgi:hypothetical protein